jgi:hypothetical protein
LAVGLNQNDNYGLVIAVMSSRAGKEPGGVRRWKKTGMFYSTGRKN